MSEPDNDVRYMRVDSTGRRMRVVLMGFYAGISAYDVMLPMGGIRERVPASRLYDTPDEQWLRGHGK